MWAVTCALFSAAAAAPAPPGISVDVTQTGEYTVSVGGSTWFAGGCTSYTTGGVTKTGGGGCAKQTLKLEGLSRGAGEDSVGAFSSTTLSWDGGSFVTTFRQYADAVIFEQSFPKGVEGMALHPANPMAGRDGVSTGFPMLTPASKDQLGFLAFSSDMTGSGYYYGTLGGGNATTTTTTHSFVDSKASAAAKARYAAIGLTQKGECRVVLNSSEVSKSSAGYNAYTPAPGSSPPQYMEHSGDFCDCSGHGACGNQHFVGHDMTEEACAAKCTSDKCACFDFSTGGGGHHAHGSGLPTGVAGFGPTAVFSKDLGSSVVISSFSQFMAASAAPGDADHSVQYGLQGSIEAVEPGYSLSYVIALAPEGGVNMAFEAWGDKLLATYGKSREMTYRDHSLNYLGYSTDNGAFYYYQTEDHQPGKRGPPYTPGKTYEETLIDVKHYADSIGVPYKYVLLDSWWYYQGQGSGVTNWIGRPDIFPHGNEYLRNRTGWPIMGHNRFWAVDNVYCKQNGGDYAFVVEKKGDAPDFNNFAWPTEQRFWDDLLYNSTKWGLFMYEQDWLDTEYDNVAYLNKNASAARTWLLQMGTAAARNDLTIQYCMSHCRHIMQSVEIPAVTNARASGDYHPGGDQWAPLGTTGIFAWAVAIAPTKDNYWSTDRQAGSSYKDYETVSEPYNRLQAAVSTLSKGPVAPSDKINASDPQLILKSCKSDGQLLQGDKPAMVLDSQHAARAFSGAAHSEIWATQTVLDGHAFAVVLGATVGSDTTVGITTDLQLSKDTKHVAYEANATSVVMGDPAVGLTNLVIKACGKWDFQHYTVSPVLGNGWSLLGEQSKWVPVSAARFHGLSWWSETGTGVPEGASVIATGPEGEVIDVAWLAPGSRTPVVVQCTIPRGDAVRVEVVTGDSKGVCEQV